jgi:hypothetical protein
MIDCWVGFTKSFYYLKSAGLSSIKSLNMLFINYLKLKE